MDSSLEQRIKNQIFKFEAALETKDEDACFTLDYELGRYRQDELVSLVRDIVPYFALTKSEIESIDRSEINRRSFTRISDANMNSKGDYGELLLFMVLEIFYNTPKFVTKARLRSTTKDQIKGFDCAHFSMDGERVVLWLGEAKFYSSFSSAIRDALSSLKDHIGNVDYIKRELRLLGGEIEINKKIESEKYDLLKSYVDGGKSLDDIDIYVPVLITYDSGCIGRFCGKNIKISDIEFKDKMTSELNDKISLIYRKKWPVIGTIKIIFFLLPLESVKDLKNKIEIMEQQLKF